MFYALSDIRKKADKLYSSGKIFSDYIQESELFPYTINLKTLKASECIANIFALNKEIETLQKSGLNLIYKVHKFTTIGEQKLPHHILFETRESLLKYIGKHQEFRDYERLYKHSTQLYPNLKSLYDKRVNLLVQNLDKIERILHIIAFFEKKPKPNVYIRELSIVGVDTKFIQQNRLVVDAFLEVCLGKENYIDMRVSKNGDFEMKYFLKSPEALIRFRILDENLYIQNLSDLTLTCSEFERLNIACSSIYIVENKITTLSFPLMNDAIVIFGQGYGVGVLKNISWLKDKKIYYWGDIDVDGFAILSQIRGYYAQVESILMNVEVLEKYKKLAIKSEPKYLKRLENLTHNELDLYEKFSDDCYGKDFRLEQEKIPFNYVIKEV